jgi:RNA polymerase sigma factor (sigma-70 family)
MDIQNNKRDHFHESQVIVCWQQFLSGDSHAYGQVIEYHYAALFQYGMKMQSDKAFVEDCIQEMFTTLWTKRERLKPDLHVKSYLLKCLRHKILRQLEQLKSNRKHILLFGRSLVDAFTAEFSVETTIIDMEQVRQRKAQLHKCLNTLSPRQQEIIYLRYFEELDHEQVAVIMNLNKAAVYNLLSIALKRLKSQWETLLLLSTGMLESFLKVF